MLDNTDNKNISILSFDQEWFPTSMFELWSYITFSLTLVYLELIDGLFC